MEREEINKIITLDTVVGRSGPNFNQMKQITHLCKAAKANVDDEFTLDVDWKIKGSDRFTEYLLMIRINSQYVICTYWDGWFSFKVSEKPYKTLFYPTIPVGKEVKVDDLLYPVRRYLIMVKEKHRRSLTTKNKSHIGEYYDLSEEDRNIMLHDELELFKKVFRKNSYAFGTEMALQHLSGQHPAYTDMLKMEEEEEKK